LLQRIKIFFLMVLCMTLSIPAFAAGSKIQLQWASAEDAVMYELEIAREPVDTNINAPVDKVVYTTTTIYTPGTELSADLIKNYNLNQLYFRVRPLDFNKAPVGKFSRPVCLKSGKLDTNKPAIIGDYKREPAPLYNVYSWIPVLNAASYRIEVTNHVPENPNGVVPSKYHVRTFDAPKGFDYYDWTPYLEAGTYYWRVLAIDENQQPIGVYSDAIAFKVKKNCKWAAFGDSITHGGGAISNPPSDRRYTYPYYLPFEVKNLGRSGDTAKMLNDRFDREVLPFSPKYLLILGGSNSIRGGTSAQEVIESLTEIKEKCLANGIRPIFLTVPPLNPERIQAVFNQPTAEAWREELAKVNDFIKTQPDFVDIYTVLADDRGLLPVKYSQDGLHPDISGKKEIGKAIKEYLKKHPMK